MPCFATQTSTPTEPSAPRGHRLSLLPALISIALSTAFGSQALAQVGEQSSAPGRVEVTDVTDSSDVASDRRIKNSAPPVVGRKAAQKYMGVRPDAGTENSQSEPSGSGSRIPAGSSAAHYLALHVGGYVTDEAYNWGKTKSLNDVGGFNAGVTYRVGEWVNSMDLAIRMDVSSFDLPEGGATKLALLPVILFPDASSRFPLYFGFGAGLGVMARQIENETPITLDYQLLLGVRFFDIFDSTGFFIESGIKNHVHIFSDGQFNGTFITAGTVFTF